MNLNLGGETVTVLDPGQETGRDVTTIAPLAPRPTGDTKPDAADLALSGWVLYLPAGDPIARRQVVLVRGVRYIVQGQPADWGYCVVVEAYQSFRNTVVNLRHPSTNTWSDANRSTSLTPGTAYATDVKAHIVARTVRSSRDAQLGEEVLPLSPYLVGVDLQLAPNEGDEVEVLSADDPTLVGRFLRIDHVIRGGDAADRQLYCSLTALPSTD